MNKKNKKKILSLYALFSHMPFFFAVLFFFSFLSFIYLLFLFLLLYYYLNTWFILFYSDPFLPRNNLFFSVHFILNELSPSHFLTFEIFVQISSLKSLVTYYSENRKIFRLSQNSTKRFRVTRFRDTNLTAQSVSSSEI